MKTLLATTMPLITTLLILSLTASAQDGFDAQVEAGVSAATASPRKTAAAIKERAKAQPGEIRDGIIPRFQQKRFPSPSDGKCGLKTYTVMDYELRDSVKNDESSRLTLMGAVIETTSPDCIRDYAVVQYIRGCVYHTRHARETGVEVERAFDVARRFRGPRVVFNHPGFEVDQTQLDPMYAAYPSEEDRHALLYIADSPLRLSSDRASMLADMKPFNNPNQRTFLKDLEGTTSVTFITDLPEGGVSGVNEEGTMITASNSSLDFRTCLYRVKDVPTTGDPAGEGVAPESGGPIQCFGWMSRYTFEPATKDFVTDKFSGVDPFCATAPPRAPLPGS